LGLGSILWDESSHIAVIIRTAGVFNSIFLYIIYFPNLGQDLPTVLKNPTAAETGLPDLPPGKPPAALFKEYHIVRGITIFTKKLFKE
jgi:hypothetical protein